MSNAQALSARWRNHRTVAAAAHRLQQAAGKAPTALQACSWQLQKCFSRAMARTGQCILSIQQCEVLSALARRYGTMAAAAEHRCS